MEFLSKYTVVGATTLSIMTSSIMGLFATLSIMTLTATVTSDIMLSVNLVTVMLSVNMLPDAFLIVLLSDIVRNVVMLSVIMMNVVAPFCDTWKNVHIEDLCFTDLEKNLTIFLLKFKK